MPVPLAAVALLAAALLLPPAPARAFEELNAAQALIYDRAHLASTAPGDELLYRYSASLGEAPAIEDAARVRITAAPSAERRDVALDFLAGERRLELPDFEGFRGNPVIIAMLEHLAQSLSGASGGGALYVRNRIRDGLARDDATVEPGSATFGGDEIDTVTLEFTPFRDDPYLGARPGFGEARVRLVFSEAVPGGVLSIGARSAETETDTPDAARFEYELRLDDNPEQG